MALILAVYWSACRCHQARKKNSRFSLKNWDTPEIINKILKQDTKKAMDAAASVQFDATPLRIVPTAGTDTAAIVLTTNGTATLTNNVAMGKEHVKTVIDTMKERNIAPFSAEDYACLALPTTLRNFKNDLESIQQYSDPGYRQIMKGELGRYENCRFFEQTFVAAGGLGTATDGLVERQIRLGRLLR